MSLVTVHLRIAGFVHGVSFRATMAKTASDRGVRGWVRNLPDGTVEAVLEGRESDVLRVVDWAKRGPPRATVQRVDIKHIPPRNFRDFRIES